MKNSAIVLLSGGLDSVVSLAYILKSCDNVLALTFDYGQMSFEREYRASKKICEMYKIKHEVVKLPWLNAISTSSLNKKFKLPKISENDLDNIEITKNSAKSVWVPNRNALFVNIAACYCESLCYNLIVIGANKEEGQTFKDNTSEFIDSINNSLKNSIQSEVKLIAPLINLNKNEIVKLGIELNIDFKLIYSCYLNQEKHCGVCESCLRLKRALKDNKLDNVIKEIF